MSYCGRASGESGPGADRYRGNWVAAHGNGTGTAHDTWLRFCLRRDGPRHKNIRRERAVACRSGTRLRVRHLG